MGVNIKAESYTVKATGELTGEEYFGVFKFRPILPHSLQLEKDRIRRELLGDTSRSPATKRAENQSEVFSELVVHIVDAPKFWTESQGGLNLYDDNVVKAVHDGLNKVQNDFVVELKKKKEQAEKDLRSIEAPEPDSSKPA